MFLRVTRSSGDILFRNSYKDVPRDASWIEYGAFAAAKRGIGRIVQLNLNLGINSLAAPSDVSYLFSEYYNGTRCPIRSDWTHKAFRWYLAIASSREGINCELESLSTDRDPLFRLCNVRYKPQETKRTTRHQENDPSSSSLRVKIDSA